MKKMPYIKPSVKIEILDAGVLMNGGSPAGGNNSGNNRPRYEWNPCWWFTR